MPLIALAYPESAAPIVLADADPRRLALRLAALGLEIDPLGLAPADLAAALARLPRPSGLYASRLEAEAEIRALEHARDAALLCAVARRLGVTRPAELSDMLGFADPGGRIARRILAGECLLSGPARRVLAHIAAHGPMTSSEAVAAFARIGAVDDAAALARARAELFDPVTGATPTHARLGDWLGMRGRAGIARAMAGGSLSGPARRALAHTLSDGPLGSRAAARILRRVDRGRWRNPPR